MTDKQKIDRLLILNTKLKVKLVIYEKSMETIVKWLKDGALNAYGYFHPIRNSVYIQRVLDILENTNIEVRETK